MKVPEFLAHLKTDPVGRPVPFINRWGATEEPKTWYVKPDPIVKGAMAAFMRDRFDEGPNFMKQCIQRQRASAVLGLCQVCGRAVDWADRCLVVARSTAEVIEMDGEKHAAVIEPWMHSQCARFAVEICPALIRRRRDEHLYVLTNLTPKSTKLVHSVGWIEGGRLEEFTKQNPVVMFVKILVPGRLVPLDAYETG